MWMRYVLLAAALDSLVRGAGEPSRSLGILLGAYGVAYAIAAFDPRRHWPIVLTGLLAKIIEPVAAPRAPALFHDVIWWAPFAFILIDAYRASAQQERVVSPEVQLLALRARTERGATLLELSRQSPVLLVFLRHTGCTFCREALADLAADRERIESSGATLVLAHMDAGAGSERIFSRYGLNDAARVSDPARALYRAFGLGRAHIRQLCSPRFWWRVFEAGVLARHGVGRQAGDGFQMPGAFVIYHGQVIRAYRHHSAADRPDYLKLVEGVS